MHPATQVVGLWPCRVSNVSCIRLIGIDDRRSHLLSSQSFPCRLVNMFHFRTQLDRSPASIYYRNDFSFRRTTTLETCAPKEASYCCSCHAQCSSAYEDLCISHCSHLQKRPVSRRVLTLTCNDSFNMYIQFEKSCYRPILCSFLIESLLHNRQR